MNSSISVLYAIEPVIDKGTYLAKVQIGTENYAFLMTVDESGKISVVKDSSEGRLFSSLGHDIDSYTNVFKAVGRKHQGEELSLPIYLNEEFDAEGA